MPNYRLCDLPQTVSALHFAVSPADCSCSANAASHFAVHADLVGARVSKGLAKMHSSSQLQRLLSECLITHHSPSSQVWLTACILVLCSIPLCPEYCVKIIMSAASYHPGSYLKQSSILFILCNSVSCVHCLALSNSRPQACLSLHSHTIQACA